MCCISNKYILFAGRFLAGFGVGLESVVVPVLLSEIATADTRGTITTLHQLQITFGIFIAGIVGYGFVENVNHGWVYVQVNSLFLLTLPFPGWNFDSSFYYVPWNGVHPRISKVARCTRKVRICLY